MKVLCVIDSLGSGGAQRQIINLASGLKNRGHEVEILTYHPQHYFYKKKLIDLNVKIYELSALDGFSISVVFKIISLIKSNEFSGIISFLPSCNIYSILAKIFSYSKIKLIVSERSSKESDPSFARRMIQRLLYIFADKVVVNSFNHGNYLKKYPWLREKVIVIYNGYDLNKNVNIKIKNQNKVPTLLIIGRIDCGKNGLTLIKALILFSNKFGDIPSIWWAGRQENDSKSLKYRMEMDRLLNENSVIKSRWQWLGEQADVSKLLFECDALVHVSLFEGLPNAICEAFISATPVIASAICEHPLLVKDGIRGFLCNPLSPESICSAIEKFIMLSPEQRLTIGLNARSYAEKYLSLNRMTTEYEALLI